MKEQKIAVLLTCHNRKRKTLECLESLFVADIPNEIKFDVFLTDDGSNDGTEIAVKNIFPQVNIIKGDGSLFWAGGMRLSWRSALEYDEYDAFLLLNDDVVLEKDFIINLLIAEAFSINKRGQKGIYSGSTMDNKTKKISYGASKIRQNHILVRLEPLEPKHIPQDCEITNANILWVDNSVVKKIGILDSRFTHGIADYDYSLRAHKKGVPVLMAPNICGTCEQDHGNNWKSSDNSLSTRIKYLKSPKGLAYNEYLYYIRTHFPMFLPYSFVMLWIKTLFPDLWDKFKTNKK